MKGTELSETAMGYLSLTDHFSKIRICGKEFVADFSVLLYLTDESSKRTK